MVPAGGLVFRFVLCFFRPSWASLLESILGRIMLGQGWQWCPACQRVGHLAVA